MKTIEFTAWGKPKAQPRAKACIRGKHAGVYDPGTADDWKSIVRSAAKEAWNGVPFNGPVKVYLRFYMPRPKSHFGKNGLKQSVPNYVTTKPDLDNLEKSVLDAVTNVGMWRDDSQVVEVSKAKKYSVDKPLAWVKIEEVEP